MNDSQYLEWIASNLETFRPDFNTAYMVYINKAGCAKYINVTIAGKPSDVELLKACVDKAQNE